MLLNRFDKRIAFVGLVLALLVITAFSLMPSQEVPAGFGWDKLNHWAAFFILTFLAGHAYPQQQFWKIASMLLLYGIGIEVAQYFTRYRSADILDVLADSIGILIYGLCIWLNSALFKARISTE